jgi:hypothetical protein
MAISDLLELLLTFAVLILVWVVPRLAFGRLRRKPPGKTANPSPTQPVQQEREDIYDWDEAAAGRWVKRQKGLENGEAETVSREASAARGAQALSAEEPGGTVSVFPQAKKAEALPESGPKISVGRSRLRQAIIWKEILDTPKALRREPFGEHR